jgi:hypothetical protein
MSMILDGSNGVTFNDASLQGAAASPFGLKNRIINGDMRIDQRNAGASITPSSGFTYSLDRWQYGADVGSKVSIQRNAGSVTPPAGYTNYLGVTSLSAYTAGASEQYDLIQHIEGYNTADLAWGTADAKTITLSFWVRSSLTGTFSGSLVNGAGNRAYPFTYTISSANTWEKETITIPGDTSGTWYTDNTAGVNVKFDFGSGSNFLGTANAWTGSEKMGVTGSVSVVGTNGATWYVTGVQFEVGSTATPFERRMYGTELVLCERYAQFNRGSPFRTFSTTVGSILVALGTTMRAAPSGVVITTTNAILNVGQAWVSISSTLGGFENATDAGGTLNITSASTLSQWENYFFNAKRILFTAEL